MTIEEWRKRIDAIDRRLVKLLNQRAQCSLAIGRLKRARGSALFHRERERRIAANARRSNRGPLPDYAVQHLFEQILLVTRAAVRQSLRRERTPRRNSSG